MATDAQIKANRENAKLSTGARTESGKAKSSLNAVKTGLTGRTVLLPSDDAEAYQTHVDGFFDRWDPVGDEERNLVQSLADTEWRLLRIPALEMGIYALGRLEFAAEFANEEEAVRKHLIEAKIFLTYRKDLSNLSLQESRLRRQRERDTETLEDLQHNRREQTKRQLDLAAGLCEQARREGKPFGEEQLAENGFDFSMEQVGARIAYWKRAEGAINWEEYRAQLKAQREREKEELQRELDAA
ncbi:MAG: hypothetical protein JO138_19310 [Acidobacteriaceae bacterium]|nr:hypothetical protein [Acidobacteriaceae bacterium]